MHRRTFSAYGRKPSHDSKTRRSSHKRTLSVYNGGKQQVAKMRRCLSLGTVPYREMSDNYLINIAREFKNRSFFIEDEEDNDDEGKRQLGDIGKATVLLVNRTH